MTARDHARFFNCKYYEVGNAILHVVSWLQPLNRICAPCKLLLFSELVVLSISKCKQYPEPSSALEPQNLFKGVP